MADESAPESHTAWSAKLNEAEGEKLLRYAAAKGMSTSAILRQAFLLYDIMERTPGALLAVGLLLAVTDTSASPTQSPAAVIPDILVPTAAPAPGSGSDDKGEPA